jgi:hypothetical protein
MHCGTSSDNSTVHFSVKRKTIDSRSLPGRMINARFHRQHSDKRDKLYNFTPAPAEPSILPEASCFLSSLLHPLRSVFHRRAVSSFLPEVSAKLLFPMDCRRRRLRGHPGIPVRNLRSGFHGKMSFYSPARTFRMPEIFGAEREDHGNSPPALPALRRVSSQFC